MKTSTAENQAFAERVKYLIDKKFDGNMSELAREMKRRGKQVSPQTVQTWVGDRGSIPRPATLKILADALGVNEILLRYGQIETLQNDLTPQLRTNPVESNNLIYDLDTIVLWTTEDPSEDEAPISIHFKADEKEAISIPRYIFDRAKVQPENAKFIRSTDDSMNEYIQLWDICGIDISDTSPKDGEIYAVLFEDQIMFKQIFKESGNRLVLHSKNPAYREKNLKIDEAPDFIIIGRQFYRAG